MDFLKRAVLVILMVCVCSQALALAVPFNGLWSGLLDDNGRPLSGGRVYFYAAGTTTPTPVWDEANKVTSRTYVDLDAYGRAKVYGDGTYKVVVHKLVSGVYAEIYQIDYQEARSSISPSSLSVTTLTGTTATIASLSATNLYSTRAILASPTITAGYLFGSTLNSAYIDAYTGVFDILTVDAYPLVASSSANRYYVDEQIASLNASSALSLSGVEDSLEALNASAASSFSDVADIIISLNASAASSFSTVYDNIAYYANVASLRSSALEAQLQITNNNVTAVTSSHTATVATLSAYIASAALEFSAIQSDFALATTTLNLRIDDIDLDVGALATRTGNLESGEDAIEAAIASQDLRITAIEAGGAIADPLIATNATIVALAVTDDLVVTDLITTEGFLAASATVTDTITVTGQLVATHAILRYSDMANATVTGRLDAGLAQLDFLSIAAGSGVDGIDMNDAIIRELATGTDPTDAVNLGQVQALVAAAPVVSVVGDVSSGTWEVALNPRSYMDAFSQMDIGTSLYVTNSATFSQYFAVDMQIYDRGSYSATEALELARTITVVASGVTKIIVGSTDSVSGAGSATHERPDCFSFVVPVPAGQVQLLSLRQFYVDRNTNNFRALIQDTTSFTVGGRIYTYPLAVRP